MPANNNRRIPAALAAIVGMAFAVCAAALAQQLSESITTSSGSDYPYISVYTTMRALADPLATGRAELRDRLKLYQGLAHDKAVRADDRWLSGDELKKRCDEFTRQHDKAVQMQQQAAALRPQPRPMLTGNYQYRQSMLQQWQVANQQLSQEKDGLMRNSLERLLAAARLWPDPLIRRFLLAQASLLARNYSAAEQEFSACSAEGPLVAAFYEGRAMARGGQNRLMDALDDRVKAFYLDTTDSEAYLALESAYHNAPGQQSSAPAFKTAKKLMDEYELPSGYRTAAQRGQTLWSMPGGAWKADPNDITVPQYHSVIARKTVAVPIAAGLVIADNDALEDAAEILLEVDKGQYVPLTQIKLSGQADKDAEELHLAVLAAPNCKFKLVELADFASIKNGQELTAQVQSLPAELEPGQPRKFLFKVRSVADGKLSLNSGLRRAIQPRRSLRPTGNW